MTPAQRDAARIQAEGKRIVVCPYVTEDDKLRYAVWDMDLALLEMCKVADCSSYDEALEAAVQAAVGKGMPGAP